MKVYNSMINGLVKKCPGNMMSDNSHVSHHNNGVAADNRSNKAQVFFEDTNAVVSTPRQCMVI